MALSKKELAVWLVAFFSSFSFSSSSSPIMPLGFASAFF